MSVGLQGSCILFCILFFNLDRFDLVVGVGNDNLAIPELLFSYSRIVIYLRLLFSYRLFFFLGLLLII
jgi:hypothetical protein